MANIFGYPKFRFTLSDGTAAVGYKLYTYEAGTVSLKDNFTDQSGDAAGENPRQLDGNGETELWLGSGGYKLVLADSDDAVQWTIDNVNIPQLQFDAGDPSNIELTASGELGINASDASGTIGFYINSLRRVQITSTALLPQTSGDNFGSGTQRWNLFGTGADFSGTVKLNTLAPDTNDITVTSPNGLSSGTGEGKSITLTAGNGDAAGSDAVGGNIVLTAGESGAAFKGGDVVLTPGNAASGNLAGFVAIQGTTLLTGAAGTIPTFTDGDTTPSVRGSNVWIASNSADTTITAFDDALTGQFLFLIFTTAHSTIAESGNIKLASAFTSSADDTMTLIFDGTNWYEIARSVN